MRVSGTRHGMPEIVLAEAIIGAEGHTVSSLGEWGKSAHPRRWCVMHGFSQYDDNQAHLRVGTVVFDSAAKKGHVMAMARASDTLVHWCYTCDIDLFHEAGRLGGDGVVGSALARLPSALGPVGAQVIRETDPASVTLSTRADPPVRPSWVSGRSVVIGNAARDPVALVDHVGDSALEDAFWLAAAMRTRNFAVERALRDFQQHRLEKSAEVQRCSRDAMAAMTRCGWRAYLPAPLWERLAASHIKDIATAAFHNS